MEYIHTIHSILRWLVLAEGLTVILFSLSGMMSKRPFGKADSIAATVFTSVVDLQLLLGLILYFTSANGFKSFQLNGKEVMKDSYLRFFAVEHIVGMLIAIILIHIGKAKSKKATDDYAKHKISFIYYLIGMVLILASIPWPFRKGFEALGWM